MHYLEFSCQQLEISLKPGEIVEGTFTISSDSDSANGDIYSSDSKMILCDTHFVGKKTEVSYKYDGTYEENDNEISGELIIISNQGEYRLPYKVVVRKPVLTSSLGDIKNLFHFANLAKASWNEAVDVFYSHNFMDILKINDKHLVPVYLGLSHFKGNQQNVEEFLCACKKKVPVDYTTDVEGFELEDIMDSTVRTFMITKSGWGYTNLSVSALGDFIELSGTRIQNEDFLNNSCPFTFMIDASRLHEGLNSGKIIIEDTRNRIDIDVNITINKKNQSINHNHDRQKAIVMLTDAYVEKKLKIISQEAWLEKSQSAVEILERIDEEDLMAKLYYVQILLTKEQFDEARQCLESLEKKVKSKNTGIVERCYFLYLFTLYNRDERYLDAVMDEIETAYGNNNNEWRIALLLMYLDEDFGKSSELKWHFLEELFILGCNSPAILCEAVLIIMKNPSLLLKLEPFELNVLWFAAKKDMLTEQIIIQIQYLTARVTHYSDLLFRILSAIYDRTKSLQSITAICHVLIMGDKKGKEYFKWYERGVEAQVRVTKLYEYYMMSIDMNYSGKLPKIVVMYFAYQSNLDYKISAFLYSYVIKHQDDFPQLEQNYRIAIERFVVDQIKAGHIDENLAFLYENILAPQMLRDEMAYAFTPLLFMHRLTVANDKIKNVIVINEKIYGESVYPVENHTCYLPVYGNEYSIFLQDESENRFYQSIEYSNYQYMNHHKLVDFIGDYIKGRLSFDIFQCEKDKRYIAITNETLPRFRSLCESEQVIDSFKKEIRTKLLHFYYDNDMIGELDAFLEETEVESMEEAERAEFIRFLISRGMFEKAYRLVKRYGYTSANIKSIARLVTKRIVSNEYMEEPFLVKAAFYIYKNTRYDEIILKYLMMYFEGLTSELKNMWKAAKELDVPTNDILYRMLMQMQYTHVSIPEKYDILLEYTNIQDYDEDVVKSFFEEASRDYFIKNEVVSEKIFIKMYDRYRQTGCIDKLQKLSLMKLWSESSEIKKYIPKEIIYEFVEEILSEDKLFPFFSALADDIEQLHYFKNKVFVEYRTESDSAVRIHYIYVDGITDNDDNDEQYITEELTNMYGGIYVKAFDLFYGEHLMYYVTEISNGEETATESNMISGTVSDTQKERYHRLNECIISLGMNDTYTTNKLLEEYMSEDYVVRELFRVI